MAKLFARATAIIILFAAAIVLFGRYQTAKIKEKANLEIEAKRAEHQRLFYAERARQREDSAKYYLGVAAKFEKTKPGKALENLDIATRFSNDANQLNRINVFRKVIVTKRTAYFINARRYNDAIGLLNNILLNEPDNTEALYNRALCYSKTGKTAEGVRDLRVAIENGNSKAQRLYNKINPLRKKIIGYVTRCCDGTTSNARGRGACSWHGGVCSWNDPIYEQYRKY